MEIAISKGFGWKPKRLPETLVHRKNLEFLAGGSYLGVANLAEVLNAVLREAAADLELLALANNEFDIEDQRHINVYLLHGESAPRFDVYKRGGAAWFSGPVGPKISIFVRSPGRPDRCVELSMLAILFNARSVCEHHVVYTHSFASAEKPHVVSFPGQIGGLGYIGVTKRGWATRYREHEQHARSGSPYLFHRAIREKPDHVLETHSVVACGLEYSEAMQVEEALVERMSLYPKGLNMIPGGFAGIRYLAAQGFKTPRKNWEHREDVLRSFANHCERTGRPNPLLSARWLDDSFAARMICANPRNFSAADVQNIRSLANAGASPAKIADAVGAAPGRIKDLIAGRTYRRVH